MRYNTERNQAFFTVHRIVQIERKENQFPKSQLKAAWKEAQNKFKLGDSAQKLLMVTEIKLDPCK